MPEHGSQGVFVNATARMGREGIWSEGCRVLGAYDRDALSTAMASDFLTTVLNHDLALGISRCS